MLDGCRREINYLRISVTDRCNLRCKYCMPENGTDWISHQEILRYEEIIHLARQFAELGIRRVRLTGGEPLVRRNLSELIAGLKAIPGIDLVCLTTNGLLLEEQLPALLEAGLDGVNVSLDTLDRAQYTLLTRRDALDRALAGLEAALSAKGLSVKLNCVPMADTKDQWVPLARLAQKGLDVRFIELMPIGLGSQLSGQTQNQVLEELENAFGPATPCTQDAGNGPSFYMTFPGFQGRIGFISAISHQFCRSCNRIRLTATGFLKTCLQYETGVDLRALLRGGAEDAFLRSAIESAVLKKPTAHHFHTEYKTGDEIHRMNQIGG